VNFESILNPQQINGQDVAQRIAAAGLLEGKKMLRCMTGKAHARQKHNQTHSCSEASIDQR